MSVASLSRPLARVVIALSLAVGVGLGVPIASSASAKTPQLPARWHLPPRDISHLAGVKVETLSLKPSQCSAFEPMSGPTCKLIHYSYGERAKFQPVPKVWGAAYAFDEYLPWRWDDQVCSQGGCWFGRVTMTEDGGYIPYDSIWKIDQGCTASGYNIAVTWCGVAVNFNRGGSPYQGIQLGLNFNSCVAAYQIGCNSHGMRRWYTNNGYPGDFDAW